MYEQCQEACLSENAKIQVIIWVKLEPMDDGKKLIKNNLKLVPCFVKKGGAMTFCAPCFGLSLIGGMIKRFTAGKAGEKSFRVVQVSFQSELCRLGKQQKHDV